MLDVDRAWQEPTDHFREANAVRVITLSALRARDQLTFFVHADASAANAHILTNEDCQTAQ